MKVHAGESISANRSGGAFGDVQIAPVRGSQPRREILTIDDVATYLRLKPQTIYKWAREKRIPAAKLGREWRFRKSIIDRWLDDQILGRGPEFANLRQPAGGAAARKARRRKPRGGEVGIPKEDGEADGS